MRHMRFLAIPLALAALIAVPASSQMLKGHNSRAPVDVDADRIEVQDRADRGMFVGNVIVRQAGMTLRAARLTVAYDRGGGGTQIQRIDASGGVSVENGGDNARGDFAVYDLGRRLITMVGGVTLSQGANQVRGGRLTIDLDSGRAVVDGRSTGGAPGVEGSGGGRVSGHFTVSNREQ